MVNCLHGQRVKPLCGSLRDATDFHLTFDDRLHELDNAQNDARTTEIHEARHRLGATLDGTVLLLDDIVQILLLVDPDRRLTFSVERPAMRGRMVNRNSSIGYHFFEVAQAQGLGQVSAHAGQHHIERIV